MEQCRQRRRRDPLKTRRLSESRGTSRLKTRPSLARKTSDALITNPRRKDAIPRRGEPPRRRRVDEKDTPRISRPPQERSRCEAKSPKTPDVRETTSPRQLPMRQQRKRATTTTVRRNRNAETTRLVRRQRRRLKTTTIRLKRPTTTLKSLPTLRPDESALNAQRSQDDARRCQREAKDDIPHET